MAKVANVAIFPSHKKLHQKKDPVSDEISVGEMRKNLMKSNEISMSLKRETVFRRHKSRTDESIPKKSQVNWKQFRTFIDGRIKHNSTSTKTNDIAHLK